MEYIEIAGAVIGLLYLYLEYRASVYLWPVGVIMPLFYIYIFFVSRFYADMGINIYYLFASIYGWIRWNKSASQEQSLAISHMPYRYWGVALLALSILFAGIAWILIRFTDSPVPFGDSFTTALSIVAMWMLANKYIEQWGLWIVVNVVSCALYAWKGLYPTALLYVVYSIVPVFGYFKWKQLMLSEQKETVRN
ncbi:nicotinamide riboside transporter PnuC [Macellibacteroides fermentans]|jgi:nicotinamide mononucleotide transporter|uniref:nicotinamide riboside transporter PnuC n=1 Tax=Macellibacteroides fermentans TaxID=879969 RepID=UPI00406BE759